MKKYKASWGWGQLGIAEVEVIRETEKMVMIASESWFHKKGERRELKCSNGERWFDTWVEARDHLLPIAESRVKTARDTLAGVEGDLCRIELLTGPQ